MTDILNRLRSWLFPLGAQLNENFFKASLIISLRWLILLVEFLLAVFYGFLGKLTWGNYASIVLSIVVLVVFNAIITINLKSKTSPKTYQLFFQMIFDLLQLFIFLKLVTPASNPLVEIFYLPLVVALIALPVLWNFFFMVLIIGLIRSFYFSELADHHNYHHFYSHVFTIALLWMTLNLLKSFIHHFQIRLESVQNYKQRMDHLKVVGAMTSGFCHQLATPLNTIKIRLDRMNRNQVFSLDDINSALKALEQCEDAIRGLSELRSEETAEKLELVDLREFCEKLIAKSYPQIQLEYEDNVDPLFIHPQLLTQTLLDLFDNAFDASKEGEMTFKVYRDINSVYLEVINTNAAVPQNVLTKLGEPFNSTKESGAGLGLFNAYNSSLVMNGSFQLFNRQNKVHAVLSLPLNQERHL